MCGMESALYAPPGWPEVVRPPGAPHRLGGSSQVITGSLSVLTNPTVTTEQVNAILARLADHARPLDDGATAALWLVPPTL